MTCIFVFLNSDFTACFPSGKPKFLSADNKRYIKLTAVSSSGNYGVVLVMSQSGVIATYISDTNYRNIFTSSGCSITVSRDGLVTTFDLQSEYAHSFAVIGGGLTSGTLEAY